MNKSASERVFVLIICYEGAGVFDDLRIFDQEPVKTIFSALEIQCICFLNEFLRY